MPELINPAMSLSRVPEPVSGLTDAIDPGAASDAQRGPQPLLPLKPGVQGLAGAKTAPADRFADALVNEPGIGMTMTWRGDEGVYEARSKSGSVRFERTIDPDGEVRYPIVSVEGDNPLANTDPRWLPTLAEQNIAAGGPDQPVPAEATSYPDAFRRIAQLFDDPNAPDLAYSQAPGGDPDGSHGGTHGNLDVLQSRAPLILAGPGIAAGATNDAIARVIDIAPTVAQSLGVHTVTGTGPDGRQHDGQFLKWQDGESMLTALADPSAPAGVQHAARAVVFVLDGMNQAVLQDAIDGGQAPNIARLASMGTTMRYGQIADFPTVTWANHNAMLSGASPGHTGIVNNVWVDRAAGDPARVAAGHEAAAAVDAAAAADPAATPGAAVAGGGGLDNVTPYMEAPDLNFKDSLRTARFLSPDVETLYEAVGRSFPGARTASLNDPSGRGATVAPLEFHGLGTLALHAPAIARDMVQGWRHVSDPKLRTYQDQRTTELQDGFGVASGLALLRSRKPPKLTVFELEATDHAGHNNGPQSPQVMQAIGESDRHIGRVLNVLDKRGLTDSTMFVLTSDHGMEACTDADPGVSDAAKKSGVSVINAAPFVYIQPPGVPAAAVGTVRTM